MNTPCVGCGWCCLDNPCEVSHRLHGYQKRCPELLWNVQASRYVCKLMDDPEKGEEAKRSNFEGQGCCNTSSPFREDVRNRDKD